MEENKYGEGIPFERIRRITGYLTGNVARWNDSKLAELKDRVKHNEENKEFYISGTNKHES